MKLVMKAVIFALAAVAAYQFVSEAKVALNLDQTQHKLFASEGGG